MNFKDQDIASLFPQLYVERAGAAQPQGKLFAKILYLRVPDDTPLRRAGGNGVLLPVGTLTDMVSRTEIEAMAKTIKDEVEKAWEEGRPFTSKRGHDRNLDGLMKEKFGTDIRDRNIVTAAIRKLKKDGEIQNARQKRDGINSQGFKVVHFDVPTIS